MQKYPFQINTKILKLTAEISEIVGHMGTLAEAARSPQLRRNNRIKMIYSSLAIEQNTLSLLEVADVSQLPLKPKAEIREQAVLGYLSKHNEISNSDVCKLLSVSAATANRVFNDMANRGLIYRFRKGKSWAYKRLQL